MEVYKNEKKSIVVSKYDVNAIGVPVLFGASVFDDLLKIQDKQGVLKYVKRHLDQVAFSEFKNGKVDVNKEADIQKYLLS